MTCPMASAVAPFTVSLTVGNLENGGTGKVVIQVHPEWAPHAAERFASFLEQDYINGLSFFKVIPGFSAHFGISAVPALAEKWHGAAPVEDFKKEENNRGRIAFVTDDGQPTEMVISMKDNEFFDRKGYVPFAEVLDGMFFIDRLTSIYGSKPEPSKIEKEGDAYLKQQFPKISYIESVELVKQQEQQQDFQLPIHSEVTSHTPILVAIGISVAIAA